MLIQKAVSNKIGKTKLFISEDAGDNRIYDSYDNRKSIEIEMIRLDDFFKAYTGKINFIKIDTQGADEAVVQGMHHLLEMNKEVKILTEFWPFGLKSFGTDPEQYLRLLIDNGFKLYNVDEEKKLIRPINIHDLLQSYTFEKRNYTNLLCTHGMLKSH